MISKAAHQEHEREHDHERKRVGELPVDGVDEVAILGSDAAQRQLNATSIWLSREGSTSCRSCAGPVSPLRLRRDRLHQRGAVLALRGRGGGAGDSGRRLESLDDRSQVLGRRVVLDQHDKGLDRTRRNSGVSANMTRHHSTGFARTALAPLMPQLANVIAFVVRCSCRDQGKVTYLWFAPSRSRASCETGAEAPRPHSANPTATGMGASVAFMNEPFNLAQKLALFDERSSPRIVATMNDYKVEVVKVEGEFVWHSHPDTDDFFLRLEGELEIELRDRNVHLRKSDLFVGPRGVEHRPALATRRTSS
jgi:mannose-6-phosphate isomerase-like protein (cupin superfamily)